MVFWILICFVALSLTGLLALVLLRAHANGEPPAAYDLRVYRQQLSDVDKDLARGVINEADANRIRTEVSRRILAADAMLQKQTSGEDQPKGISLATALLCGLVVVGGALGLYSSLGAPGYPDMSLASRIAESEAYAASRPTQQEAEERIPPQPAPEADPSYLKLVEQLRETAGARPDDAQGQALLAQHEANLGNFKAAYQAKENYIEIMSGDLDPQDYSELAELMIMATGGYVSPEAEDILMGTLSLDPRNGPARYYLGLMEGQHNRPDIAYRIWADTLRQGPAGAPWIVGIQSQIEEMAFRAGVDYTPITPPGGEPPARDGLTGPSQEDVEAAAALTAAERQEMIRGMVANLSDRLATEGGSAEEWARLISALTVLGETDRARAIYAEAQSRFGEIPAELAKIEAAASQAGLTE